MPARVPSLLLACVTPVLLAVVHPVMSQAGEPPTALAPTAAGACSGIGSGLDPAWACTFADDFDGDNLDTARWLAARTDLSGVSTAGRGCFVDDGRSVVVKNGTLRLVARRTSTPFVCHSPVGDFSTTAKVAAVTTRGRFDQTFGRFEFRAKMARIDGPGAHAALWLYPAQHTYGRWPGSGEIDVAEWYSAIPEKVYPSLHYPDGGDDVVTGHRGTVADVERFHTYAVEWTPTTMRFSYDGEEVFEHTWTDSSGLEGSQPFDHPFNVVLNQVWGAAWNAPTDESPRRIRMKIDWVRVWQRRG